jgi:hypothetical protein
LIGIIKTRTIISGWSKIGQIAVQRYILAVDDVISGIAINKIGSHLKETRRHARISGLVGIITPIAGTVR